MAENNNMTTPIAIVVAGVLIAGAVIFTSTDLGRGLLGRENPSVLGEQPSVVGNNPTADQPVDAQGPVAVSVDDDPVLGDANAPVTLIEFSDYECPYCKRSFEQVLTQIKEEYIDTGKVKLVYRDLPLPFHDPMATNAAMAANCARDQGGDSKYYEYHDAYLNVTQSNGTTPESALTDVASTVGLNVNEFQVCMDEERYADEIQNDISDAAAIGANGTPAYFIGLSTDSGVIEGTPIKGAQPYAVFKSEIDKLLQ